MTLKIDRKVFHPATNPNNQPLAQAIKEAGFDLVLTGLDKGENQEARDQVLIQSIGELPCYTIATGEEGKPEPVYGDKDRFRIMQEDLLLAEPYWYELADFIKQEWRQKKVLVDLTTLSWSAIFQFTAAFYKVDQVVGYCYTAPEKYPQTELPERYPPIVTRGIKQPYGYKSFAQEFDAGSRRHIIQLGFDRGRPNKFIEHYQWPLAETWAILGHPPYVKNGSDEAKKSLGGLFEPLEKMDQVVKVDPKEIPKVWETLTDLTDGIDVVDLVPLGSKTTLLATILFWLHLPPERQERTRILYDFPHQRKVRTEGIGDTWLYLSQK